MLNTGFEQKGCGRVGAVVKLFRGEKRTVLVNFWKAPLEAVIVLYVQIESKMKIDKIYLNYEVAPFTIQEHIDSPIRLGGNLVPYRGKTNLVSRSKKVDFIEPKTSE